MKKLLLLVLITTNNNSTFGQSPTTEQISWPDRYEPGKSKFYVHNEIQINARPEVVWRYLVDALRWESWYRGAKNLSFVSTGDTALTASSIFKWQTMGLRLQSSIKEFEPYRLLAWESTKNSIRGYHVWLLVPNEQGCKVITDESQNGWLTFFEKLFQPNKLRRLHDEWLVQLKLKSEMHE
jgi:uncharacterized protein YndB with AHSA1/START domain